MGISDIWPLIILDVSVSVSGRDKNFDSVDWVKQIAHPKVSGPYPNQLKAWIEHKGL